MSDAERDLREENKDLRQQLANARMQLKQGAASHKALGQAHDQLFNNTHQVRVQCNLLEDEVQELKAQNAKLQEAWEIMKREYEDLKVQEQAA